MVAAGMTTDAKANLYLTGKYSSSSRGRDVFTRKLSSSGSTVFTKTFGTSAYDDANGIATLNSNEIYLTGATQGLLAHPFQGGENDGYVRKLNSSGNPVWTRQLTFFSQNRFYGLSLFALVLTLSGCDSTTLALAFISIYVLPSLSALWSLP